MPLEIIRADITQLKVDAIVNAANTSLLGGGGVDGAIHAAAGPELLEACRELGGCPTGQAKITKGYRLPARYVIHTPGPVWMGGQRGERQLLASCYRSSLTLAAEYGCESVAFPMISTGAYGYPKDEALRIALNEITSFLMDHEMMIYIVTFGKEMFETTGKLFASVRAYISDACVKASEIRFSRDRNWFPAEETAAPSSFTGTVPKTCESFADNLDNRPVTEEDFGEHLRKAAPAVSRKIGFFRKRKTESRESSPKTPTPDASCPASARSSTPEPTLMESVPAAAPKSVSREDLIRYLRDQDIGFSEALLRLIDEKGMTDVQCYKQANIDRKLFNHIKNRKDYRPAKKTALAFAVALHLSPGEAEGLLRRAGYSLSSSSPMDMAVRYFLENGFYNIHDINIMLYDLDLPLLGA